MASAQAIHGFFEAYTAPATWVRREWREASAPATHPADCACTLVEEHLARCRAVQPTDEHPDEPNDVRSLLRLLDLQEWKAAALVGGAVLEEQLVAQLDGREDVAAFALRQLATSNRKRDDGARWHKPVREWGLYGLIAAGLAVGIIQAGAADLCHDARKVRNVIHTGGRVEREHALVVYQAVQLVAVAHG